MQQSSPKTLGWKWPVFLIVITAELYYMFRYSASYGVLNLLALILGSIILGFLLMRWEGSICWKRILYMERHNMPTTDEMRDGILILFAGMLMIIPGIITDVLGLFLFLPPIRWVVRKLFLKNMFFEIPSGMESQFRMYTFTTSKSADENPEDSFNNSESGFQDDYDQSRQGPFSHNPDIQIIDVKATDPKETSSVSESENPKENDNNFLENKSSEENPEKQDSRSDKQDGGN